jgi:hypothetical protein
VFGSVLGEDSAWDKEERCPLLRDAVVAAQCDSVPITVKDLEKDGGVRGGLQFTLLSKASRYLSRQIGGTDSAIQPY